MEIFKTHILEKEFEKFQKENLVEILKCDYCQKTASQSWHQKFLVANIAEKHFVKLVIILILQKKPYLKQLILLEKNILRILSKIFFLYQTKLFKLITK